MARSSVAADDRVLYFAWFFSEIAGGLTSGAGGREQPKRNRYYLPPPPEDVNIFARLIVIQITESKDGFKRAQTLKRTHYLKRRKNTRNFKASVFFLGRLFVATFFRPPYLRMTPQTDKSLSKAYNFCKRTPV